MTSNWHYLNFIYIYIICFRLNLHEAFGWAFGETYQTFEDFFESLCSTRFTVFHLCPLNVSEGLHVWNQKNTDFSCSALNTFIFASLSSLFIYLPFSLWFHMREVNNTELVLEHNKKGKQQKDLIFTCCLGNTWSVLFKVFTNIAELDGWMSQCW